MITAYIHKVGGSVPVIYDVIKKSGVTINADPTRNANGIENCSFPTNFRIYIPYTTTLKRNNNASIERYVFLG